MGKSNNLPWPISHFPSGRLLSAAWQNAEEVHAWTKDAERADSHGNPMPRTGSPKVGISACLLGQRVRYDGGHKLDAPLTDELGLLVEWVPVCPEVELGLGTPREPIRLERVDGAIRLIAAYSRIDHTDAMHAWARTRLDDLARENLSGYVLKKNSPSCGSAGVIIHGADGVVDANGRGLFAAALAERLPGLPIEEEDRLSDPDARKRFLERIYAYRRSTEAKSDSDVDTSPFAMLRRVPVTRVGRMGANEDVAAVEEPLEIRLHGAPFAVVMRTPGDDRALAAGFLLSEGVIESAADLGAVEHCRHPDHPESHNVVDVFLLGNAANGIAERLAAKRNIVTSSSCGLCGRVTIESLKVRLNPVAVSWHMSRDLAAQLPAQLRKRQQAFDATGGLHAAGLFTPHGRCERSAEDVGRHNAVDKVIGAMLLEERLPLSDLALVVSGRTSFEIVQKAWIAGLGLICAVSAPSTLAIDLASEAGITLLGFARGDGFNVYSHPERIESLITDH
jgi:FdhD protein